MKPRQTQKGAPLCRGAPVADFFQKFASRLCLGREHGREQVQDLLDPLLKFAYALLEHGDLDALDHRGQARCRFRDGAVRLDALAHGFGFALALAFGRGLRGRLGFLRARLAVAGFAIREQGRPHAIGLGLDRAHEPRDLSHTVHNACKVLAVMQVDLTLLREGAQVASERVIGVGRDVLRRDGHGVQVMGDTGNMGDSDSGHG